MQAKYLTGAIEKAAGNLPADTIVVVASTESRDMAGDIVRVDGIQWRGNSVISLWNHDVNTPIGTAEPRLSTATKTLRATIKFADTPKAREILGLVKSGVLTDVSIGFDPVESKPLPSGGREFTKSRLLEISVVAVGCNEEAIVAAKARGEVGTGPKGLTRAERLAAVAELAPRSTEPNHHHPELQRSIEYCRAVDAARVASGRLTRNERLLEVALLREGP